jgi:hypothetical protein
MEIWRDMFRVVINNDMFDLQAVLLMCWINYIEWGEAPTP